MIRPRPDEWVTVVHDVRIEQDVRRAGISEARVEQADGEQGARLEGLDLGISVSTAAQAPLKVHDSHGETASFRRLRSGIGSDLAISPVLVRRALASRGRVAAWPMPGA